MSDRPCDLCGEHEHPGDAPVAKLNVCLECWEKSKAGVSELLYDKDAYEMDERLGD